MELRKEKSEAGLENKERKIANRKHKKLATEKYRRDEFNKTLNEMKSVTLKGIGKDNAQFEKLEKSETLKLSLKYLKYMQLQLSKTFCPDATTRLQCENAYQDLNNFLTKCERRKNIAMASDPSLPPSPTEQQLSPTNSIFYFADPYASIFAPVTQSCHIESPNSRKLLDTAYTTYAVRYPDASLSAFNPQPFTVHHVNSRYHPYGYSVNKHGGNVTQGNADPHDYGPLSFPRNASSKIWRPCTFN